MDKYSIINMGVINMKITEKQITELYRAVNDMMAILGRDGEISTRHYSVYDVMNIIREIDGGVYDEKAELTVKGE